MNRYFCAGERRTAMSTKNILPFLDSDDLVLLARRILKTEDMTFQDVRFEDILPYMDEDDIAEIAEESVRRDPDLLICMMPYMDEDDLGKVLRSLPEEKLEAYLSRKSVLHQVIRSLDEDDLAEIAERITPAHPSLLSVMAPFLDEDDVSGIAVKLMKDGISVDIASLVPYMDEDGITRCMQAAQALGMDMTSLLYDRRILSNMDEDDIGRIAVQLIRDGIPVDIGELLPFMDQDSADRCFRYAAGRDENWQVYLPFVSEDALHRLLKDYIAGRIQISFDEIYPYMDEDDIRTLFRYEIARTK